MEWALVQEPRPGTSGRGRSFRLRGLSASEVPGEVVPPTPQPLFTRRECNFVKSCSTGRSFGLTRVLLSFFYLWHSHVASCRPSLLHAPTTLWPVKMNKTMHG